MTINFRPCLSVCFIGNTKAYISQYTVEMVLKQVSRFPVLVKVYGHADNDATPFEMTRYSYQYMKREITYERFALSFEMQ